MADILELEFSDIVQNRQRASQPCAQRAATLVLAIAFALTGVACKSKARPTKPGQANTTAASPNPSASGPGFGLAPPRRSFVTPAGPSFAIMAGEGLGPVRFGATVATIERLMEGKCEELSERHCRYIRAGIEYELKDGVVSGIVVYRHDRPVEGSPGKFWGRTRCAIPPDITPRMVAGYVHSVLGKPESHESVETVNANRTALREHYQGLDLEYDRGEYTKELVLGSIRVLKLDNPPKPKPVVVPKGPPEPLH
jgi:hypothetical protein